MKILLMVGFIIMMLSSITSAQWVQTNGPEGAAVFELFADGANLYAGMGGNAGVFRSTDGGATWAQKINGMGYQPVVAMAKSGSNLLASGTSSLFYSTDNGDIWTEATGLFGSVNDIAV